MVYSADCTLGVHANGVGDKTGLGWRTFHSMSSRNDHDKALKNHHQKVLTLCVTVYYSAVRTNVVRRLRSLPLQVTAQIQTTIPGQVTISSLVATKSFSSLDHFRRFHCWQGRALITTMTTETDKSNAFHHWVNLMYVHGRVPRRWMHHIRQVALRICSKLLKPQQQWSRK